MLFFKSSPLKILERALKKTKSLDDVIETVNLHFGELNIEDARTVANWLNNFSGYYGSKDKNIIPKILKIDDNIPYVYTNLLTDANKNLNFMSKVILFCSLATTDKLHVVNRLIYDRKCDNKSILKDIKCTDIIAYSSRIARYFERSHNVEYYVKDRASNIFNDEKFIGQGYKTLLTDYRNPMEAGDLIGWWMGHNNLTVEKDYKKILQVCELENNSQCVFDVLFMYQVSRGTVEDCLYDMVSKKTLFNLVEFGTGNFVYTVEEVECMLEKRNILKSIGVENIEEKPKRRM